MKKIGLFIIGSLFILPMTVFAADSSVTSVTASVDGSKVSYSGEATADVTAVMCKLYKGDTEVKKLSSEVDNGEFSGEFTVASNGKYTVYCARYEGGTIVASDEVTVSSVVSNNNTTSNTTVNSNTASNATTTSNSTGVTESNPTTLDNISYFVVMFVLGFAGLVSVAAFKKKRSI